MLRQIIQKIIKEEITTEKYKIFVDLDGVLSDFEGRTKEEFGYFPHEVDRNLLWTDIINYEKIGPMYKWFEDLKPLPDAMKLWNYVQPYDPSILSSTGTAVKDGERQKKKWVAKHVPGNPDVYITLSSKRKARYAAPNHILIDDSEYSIKPWEAAGGIGILHKSVSDTINRLQKLGI